MDYSKIIIINDSDYLDSSIKATVDQDEYSEMMINLNRIISEAVNYVENYIRHMNGISIMHQRQFSRQYAYTTLKYFHKLLGIQ